MRYTSLALAALLGATSNVEAYRSQRELHSHARKHTRPVPPVADFTKHPAPSGQYMNAKSKKFAVDGTKIPEVNFDAGESYAGQLSIDSNADNENALFFWFFPSSNPKASDEIVIWLNGGPGCSSLDGLLQENGPFLWQSGTYRPVRNPYSWTNLTNMVWVDQPVGTGLSSFTPDGPKKVVNEKVVAHNFMGFWKNFVDTFDLQGRKVYLTGESYAGMYVPYISYYMLEANDTQNFNVKGIQVNDPSIGEGIVESDVPAVAMLNAYSNIFNLNQTFMDEMNKLNVECGYADFQEKALTFPPPKNFPATPKGNKAGCNVYNTIVEAATFINPCFNLYHLIDFCPYLWDEMGFPSLGAGPNNYFNRSDVQAILNLRKPVDYTVCGDPSLGLNHGDSEPSSFMPLPRVIEMTNNVIIGSGSLDYLLMTNGTLATIQNMTWNGARGFQSKPASNFYVPYHPGFKQILYGEGPAVEVAGSGYLGTTHYERGLTWCEVFHSGHEIPQYVPGASYRHLEKLLGRISSLTQKGCFTTQEGEC